MPFELMMRCHCSSCTIRRPAGHLQTEAIVATHRYKVGVCAGNGPVRRGQRWSGQFRRKESEGLPDETRVAGSVGETRNVAWERDTKDSGEVFRLRSRLNLPYEVTCEL